MSHILSRHPIRRFTPIYLSSLHLFTYWRLFTPTYLEATKQDTQQNIQLGEESQSLDVTQHILQNLSQQTALNAQVNERILQEALLSLLLTKLSIAPIINLAQQTSLQTY